MDLDKGFQVSVKKVVMRNAANASSFSSGAVGLSRSAGVSVKDAEQKAVEYAARHGLSEPLQYDYLDPVEHYDDHKLYWDVVGTLRAYILNNLPLAM